MRLLNLKTILVATDLDASSHVALGTAHRLAEASGATLHIVHARRGVAGGDAQAAAASATAALREAMRTVGIPDDAGQIDIVSGAPAEAIASFALRVGADVIIVGPHRERDRVTGGHTLGGTARDVVNRAHAPCLVAATTLRLPLRRVLVPTDLSDTARGALLVGISWASALRLGGTDGAGTTLEAFQVTPAVGPSDATGPALAAELDELRSGTERWAGITIGSHTAVATDIAKAIGQRAVEQEADLVVIGTRGRGVDEQVRLGSVSAAVTLHVSVPTLLVPPAVWRAHGES